MPLVLDDTLREWLLERCVRILQSRRSRLEYQVCDASVSLSHFHAACLTEFLRLRLVIETKDVHEMLHAAVLDSGSGPITNPDGR